VPQNKDEPYQDEAFLRFGKLVEQLRKKQEWSQELLADKLGVDRSYVSSLESGKRNPTLRTIIEISRLFAVDLKFAGKSLLH
jgi:transcriptional regulator with XRE-family HTH domain